MPLNVKFAVALESNSMTAHFGRALHKRGTDWRVFKNEYDKTSGDVFESGDSLLLRFVIETLMQDDAGVLRLDITPYTIVIKHSGATPKQDLEARVLYAIRRMGITPVRV